MATEKFIGMLASEPEKSSLIQLLKEHPVQKKLFVNPASSICLVKCGMTPIINKCVCYKRLNERQKERLAREVNALMKLRHPNVSKLYKCVVCYDTSTFHMFSEFAEQGDMLDYINLYVVRGKRFDFDFCKKVIYQLADVVSFIHKNGYLHRDIKPENLFLNNNGNIILGDFGFAIHKDDLKNDCDIALGTSGYAAPEVVSGLSYSTASDVWSVGATIFMILTFDKIVEGINYDETVLKMLTFKYDPLKKEMIPPTYDFDLLRKIINGCIVEDPTGRIGCKNIVEIIEH